MEELGLTTASGHFAISSAYRRRESLNLASKALGYSRIFARHEPRTTTNTCPSPQLRYWDIQRAGSLTAAMPIAYRWHFERFLRYRSRRRSGRLRTDSMTNARAAGEGSWRLPASSGRLKSTGRFDFTQFPTTLSDVYVQFI